MTKLIIKPQDRQSIDFAENERSKSLTSKGSIVHEEDISNVEHIETIYDMASTDSSINLGYTSGLPHNTTIANINFSKYKYLKFTIYDASYSYAVGLANFNFGNPIIVFTSTYTSSDGLAVGRLIPSLNSNKTQLTINIYRNWSNGLSQNSGYVTKIEGVY